MLLSRIILAFLVCFLAFTLPIFGEIYTSMTEMKSLLDTEAEVIDLVDKYIQLLEERVVTLRKFNVQVKASHSYARNDPDYYVGHPVNAFHLVKRLTLDWQEIAPFIHDDKAAAHLYADNQKWQNLNFPTEEDLAGVSTAIMRLQDTYSLQASKMADGFIHDLPPAETKLSARDCLVLGKQSYIARDYYHAVLWLLEALKRLPATKGHANEEDKSTSNHTSVADKADIILHIIYSYGELNQIRQALDLTKVLLDIQPDNSEGLKLLPVYEELILEGNDIKSNVTTINISTADVPIGALPLPDDGTYKYRDEDYSAYERLCRGEHRRNPKDDAQLKCYYKSDSHPVLKIGPVRMEIWNINPTIHMFQDVIYESEMQLIKELARPKLARATVHGDNGTMEIAAYRITKTAWLDNDDHPVVQRIGRRLNQITGLSMSTAEKLQVANYGVGGHYEPHFDHAVDEDDQVFGEDGNRIATVLFYMSDVTRGGATVFPKVETTVLPKKGCAAFWYNLHPNGRGDDLTRHAACPVLVGEKWVSNKWIHERGQEFLKKCKLHYDDPW